MAGPLKLKAVDPEDLSVIAICLQDALVLVDDMAWIEDEQRFLLVANRFMWEVPPQAEGNYARTTAGLTVEQVTGVKRRGIDRRRRDRILSLLTVQRAPGGIDLIFAGGGAIRLTTPVIQVQMQDVGESWPTAWRPRHETDAA